jgi:hypothetical protein
MHTNSDASDATQQVVLQGDLKMATYTQRTVNDNGLAQIAEFLSANADRTFTLKHDRHALQAWAADAEFQIGEGNTPSIEISHIASIHGVTQEFTISDEGLDFEEIEIDE